MMHSFIVCVYNGEKYITRCLDSLINQKGNVEYEIVIVNDGSSDDSLSILNSYAANHSNIQVIDNESNIGLSASRNKGVELSKGTYFSFIDIDDYISEDYLAIVYYLMRENTDILKFNLTYVEDNNSTEQHYNVLPTHAVDGESAIQLLIEAKLVFEPAVLYVFKRSYYVEKRFRFGEGYIHEDFGLIPIALLKASNVILIDDNLYFYVQTSESITRGKTAEKQLKSFLSIKYFFELNLVEINSLSVSNECKVIFRSFLANALIGSFDQLLESEKQQYGAQIYRETIPLMRDDSLMRKTKKLIKKFKYKKYNS